MSKKLKRLDPSAYPAGDPRRIPRDLRQKYPFYDIAELQKGIEKADANIKLYEDMIEAETKRKAELRQLIARCRERDEELKRRGIAHL